MAKSNFMGKQVGQKVKNIPGLFMQIRFISQSISYTKYEKIWQKL